MEAFKNRNIFECWMAMRLGFAKGVHLHVTPLCSASFGPFLAETRKGRIVLSLFQFRQGRFQFLLPEGGVIDHQCVGNGFRDSGMIIAA